MYEQASFWIMHGMTFDVDAFCDKYVYDIEWRLQAELEGLSDDLESEDEEVRREAAQEVSEILEWLGPSASRNGRGVLGQQHNVLYLDQYCTLRRQSHGARSR